MVFKVNDIIAFLLTVYIATCLLILEYGNVVIEKSQCSNYEKCMHSMHAFFVIRTLTYSMQVVLASISVALNYVINASSHAFHYKDI